MPARALAAGLTGIVAGSAIAGAPGDPRTSPKTVLMAQLDIPVSPSFRMNLGPGAEGDIVAQPIGSHDAPAKAAPPAARPGSAASTRKADAARPAAAKAGIASAATGRTATGAVGVPPPSSAGTALAHAAAPASAAATPDPFDHLRERLAQVLGATPAGAGGKYVMRVSNHGESGDNVVSSAHAQHVAALAPSRAATPHGGAANPTTTSSDTVTAGPGASLARPSAWDYAGPSGPDAWSRLQPGFDKCATGTRQSPIDIRDGIAVDLEPIQFDYRPGSFTVLDTGRGVQVNVAPGSAITIGGRRYALEAFDFHRPSEERIDGRRFDMGVHLVHRDADGRVAIVAVMLERGSALPVVQAVWNALPLERDDPVHAAGPLDPAQLLPEDRRYYTYMGSLTTPPCTEGVLWMVMKRPVQISNGQDAIFARLYPMNARPLQAASGRLIKESQ